MSPLPSLQGTGGYRSDTAVSQNQNFVTHPSSIKMGEFITSTEGTGSWIVPAGVTWASFIVIGGGAAGCSFSETGEKAGGGGGGGGLSYSSQIMVSSGQPFPYNVGEGGLAYAWGAGNDGGDTWIKDTDDVTIVEAEGGQAGDYNAGPSSGNQGPTGGRGGMGYPSRGYACIGGGRGGTGGNNVPTSNNDYGGGGGGAGGYGTSPNSVSNGRGGGGGKTYHSGPSGWQYIDGTSGNEGAGGGGAGGRGGGGTGLYGQGTDGAGGDDPSTSPFYGAGRGGSPSAIITETAYDATPPHGLGTQPNAVGGGEKGAYKVGGLFGGGGAGGWATPPSVVGANGGEGALRIVYGCGVSFPDDAKGKYS